MGAITSEGRGSAAAARRNAERSRATQSGAEQLSRVNGMATYRLPELGRFAPCGNQGPVLVGLRHVHLDLEQEERRVLSPPGLAHVEKHVQVQQVPFSYLI